MDTRLFISKIILLLYRVRQIELDTYDVLINNSLSLIKDDKNDEVFLGNGKTKKLIEYINNMLLVKEPYILDTLLLDLELLLEHDTKLFKILRTGLVKELDENEIKKIINSLSGELAHIRREKEAVELLAMMNNKVRFDRSSVSDVMQYLREGWAQIEPLVHKSVDDKDPALIREVNFGNEAELVAAFEDVKIGMSEEGIYRTGWQALNRMLRGGFRSATASTVGALNHNYKTGFTMSIWMQLVRFNKPLKQEKNPTRKPMAARVSLEDSLELNLQFMFQYLKANEGIVLRPQEVEAFNEEEMARYTKESMEATGFSIHMSRVDPSNWGIQDLMSYIIGLEAKGYYIEIFVLDYMTMMQTIGLPLAGAGTDKKELLKRIRNFMAARDIVFISPLQLSTEAQQLRRNGTPDARFVKEIADKQYYADSKQLANEIDLELFLNKVYHNNKWYLSVGRGKHRLPGVTEEEDKYFLLPFRDKYTPLLEDVDKDDSSLKSLPRAGSDSFGDEDSLLGEIMGI